VASKAFSTSVAVAFVLLPLLAAMAAPPAAAAGTITVTAPTCGAVFVAGDDVTILWTSSGTSGNVKIDFYIGWSFTPVSIATSVADTGSFVWTIPAHYEAQDQVYIEVTDAADDWVYGWSDDFAIVEAGIDPHAITITAPVGTTAWEAGQEYNITWTAGPAVGSTVRIQHDFLYFSTPVTINDSAPNDGSYAWSIPRTQTARTTNILRVTDATNSSLFGQSACFETTPRVPPGTIVVTQPGTGDDFEQGDPMLIQWGITGTVGPFVRITLDYSYYTGGVTVAANTTNNGTFWWTVPTAQAPRTNYYIRVEDLGDDQIFDDSQTFAVHAPPPAGTITVSEPVGGAQWPVGTNQTVAWSSTGAVGSTVRILLDRHATYYYTPEVIVDSAPNTGLYTWAIPASHSRGSQFIRVVSVSDPAIEGASPTFQLVEAPPPGTITVTAPASGESLDPGIPYVIRWQQTGDLGDTVLIELDNGTGSFREIDPAALNVGTYSWTPTSNLAPGTQYRIRVTPVDWPRAAATGPTFRLTSGGLGGSIAITAPVEATAVPVGERAQVRWTSQGGVGDMVRVELEERNSLERTLLSTGMANRGVFDWSPTRDLVAAGSYRFRVTSIDDPSIVGLGPWIRVTDPGEPAGGNGGSGGGEPVGTFPVMEAAVGGAAAAAAAGIAIYAVGRRRRAAENSVVEVVEAPGALMAGPTPPMPAPPPQPPPPVAPAAPAAPSAPRTWTRADPNAGRPTSNYAGQYDPSASGAYAAQPEAPAAPAAQMSACPQCGRPCVVMQPKCGWCGLEMVWS
jgi:hypothetical protein